MKEEKEKKEEKEVVLSPKQQKKLEKEQKRNLERYGITPDEMKGKDVVTNAEAKKGFPSLKRCFKYFKYYKGLVACFILTVVCFTAINLFAPIFMQNIIDSLTLSQNDEAIKYTIYFLLVSIATVGLGYLWEFFAVLTFQKVVIRFRMDLIDAVSRTKAEKFDTVNSGTIISRVNNDAREVTNLIDTVSNGGSAIIMGLGFLAYLFFINVYLALFVTVGFLLILLTSQIYQKYNYKMQKKSRVINDKRVGQTSEIARGIRDIKSLNIRENVLKKFYIGLRHQYRWAIDDSTRGNFLWRLLRIAETIVRVGSIFLGIYLLSIGNVTLGGLLLTIMYFERIQQAVWWIQNLQKSIRTASVSAERICEILDDKDYPKETFGTKTIKNPKGEIEFKNVHFGYNKEKPIFEDLSLKIEPNTSVAFVGKSGQGKSTLLSLIPKLYELQGGKILIDGVDITKLSENGLRDLVTVVPQTPYIFNCSIKENLKYVKEDLTDEEMFDVCKKAQIHDFIMEKEKQYDSLVGENGVILSGGQKQRLAIARALLKNSKIILLDEATSALDNENQSKIQNVIEDLTKDHTVIIVAHRLSTVVNCNKIYMLEGGEIVGSGTHNELMQGCKPYQDLYKIEKKSAQIAEAEATTEEQI
ncbi:MAG: ABC transporter ATP-binding protein [Clostridia bacterium]|nr:ABC transporter ATP-binding protein [Clostridia bacterium]